MDVGNRFFGVISHRDRCRTLLEIVAAFQSYPPAIAATMRRQDNSALGRNSKSRCSMPLILTTFPEPQADGESFGSRSEPILQRAAPARQIGICLSDPRRHVFHSAAVRQRVTA